MTVNNLGYRDPKFEQDAKICLNNYIRLLKTEDTKFYLEDPVKGKFIDLYRSKEQIGSIAIVPIFIDKIANQEICFFSYDCQERKFLGMYSSNEIGKETSITDYNNFKQNLFYKNNSDIKKGEIKVIFESYYFYYIAEWHQKENETDTASIYLRCGELARRHETEYDYSFNSFMDEYQYYKEACHTEYIYRFQRAMSDAECPRDLFPQQDIKKCIDLRRESVKYPATSAYIDALAYFELYRYYLKIDLGVAEEHSKKYEQYYEHFKQIMESDEYTQQDIKLWEKERLSLFFERDTLNAKYKILSKCSDISGAAYNYSGIGDYDKALQFHFWALKFCHTKNSFEEIVSILKLKEITYYRLLYEGDSLCAVNKIEGAKNKYRESINFTLFPEYSIYKLSLCKSSESSNEVQSLPIISPQEIFSVIRNIVSGYNTKNFNELPGQKITFELDERNNKKVNVFIVTNTDAADLVLHASYYPPGSYKFLNEEVENGMLINIINTIKNVFGNFIDSSGIELYITGSADFSGFNGAEIRVEEEYKRSDLIVNDVNGKSHRLIDLINSYSDYDKNLALAFLRGYRKQQAIITECEGIKVTSVLSAKVEGRGSKYRNVEIVLRILLK